MSRTEKCLKKIATNLGVNCVAEDNTVCEVLNKIADEMPLIKGERISRVPLKVGMDLKNKVLFFDTSKTIPEEYVGTTAQFEMPGLSIVFSQQSGGEGAFILNINNAYDSTHETIYKNGVWLKDSYNVGATNAYTVITGLDERLNEFVSVEDFEVSLYEKVEAKSLYRHNVLVNFEEGTVQFEIINNDKTEINSDVQLNNVLSDTSGSKLTPCSINDWTNSIYCPGVIQYTWIPSITTMGLQAVYYKGETELNLLFNNKTGLTDEVTQIL